MALKILSWNIWLAGDLEAVLEFVKNSQADIIGMQEVVPEREPNIIKTLESLGYHSAFSSVMELREDGKIIGNAVFSRYPIKKSETFVLSEEERRMAERVSINVSGLELVVINTHLLHTHKKQSAIQDQQVESLIRLLPKQQTVVMGDFNATPDSGAIKRMGKALKDTDPSHAPTWSVYPEGCKVCNPQAIDVRLDYIFASRDLKTHSPKVESSKASDHLPISVTVGI